MRSQLQQHTVTTETISELRLFIDAATAGFTGLTVGLVNTHYVYLPIPVVISAPRKVSKRLNVPFQQHLRPCIWSNDRPTMSCVMCQHACTLAGSALPKQCNRFCNHF